VEEEEEEIEVFGSARKAGLRVVCLCLRRSAAASFWCQSPAGASLPGRRPGRHVLSPTLGSSGTGTGEEERVLCFRLARRMLDDVPDA